MPTSDKDAVPENTDKISFESDALDTDEVLATWPDGFSMTVPGLTVGQWKARKTAQESRQCKKAAEWSKGDYFVRIKKDRHAERGGLAWLGHNDNKSKQICQVQVYKCPSKEVAVQVLAEVAEKLMSGCTDPYLERNKWKRLASSSSPQRRENRASLRAQKKTAAHRM